MNEQILNSFRGPRVAKTLRSNCEAVLQVRAVRLSSLAFTLLSSR